MKASSKRLTESGKATVEQHLGLARALLKETTAGKSLVAYMALSAAVQGYDAARGVAFSTYYAAILRRALARAAWRDRLVRPPDKLQPRGDVEDLADDAEDVAEVAARRLDSQAALEQLRLAAGALDERQRLVLAIRMTGASHAAVGEAVGVSSERARQIEIGAHDRIRAVGASAEKS